MSHHFKILIYSFNLAHFYWAWCPPDESSKIYPALIRLLLFLSTNHGSIFTVHHKEVCSSHFKFFTENKLLFKKSKNYLKKRKMAGKARKSTHKKKASTNALARRRSSKPAAPKKRVEIDETVSNILTPGAQNFHRNPRGTNGVSDAISI